MYRPATQAVRFAAIVFALGLAVAATAHAAVRMQADALELPGVDLDGVQASLAPGADGRLLLQLRADRLTVPALGWKNVGFALSGVPQRAGENEWRLDGTLALTHAPGNALAGANVQVAIDTDAGSLDVNLDQRNSAIRMLMPLDQPSHWQLSLKGLPLAWLQGVLAQAWKGGRLTAGSIDGEIALDMPSDGTRLSGRVDVNGAGVDSKAGTLAAQQLAARGTFSLDAGSSATRLSFDGNVAGGQVLLGPLFAQLPAHAAQLQLSADFGARGVVIDSLHFDDGDALDFDGKLAFGADDALKTLQFGRFEAQLPQAYARYGNAWLATLGWKDLDTDGALSGSIALAQGVPSSFVLHASHLKVDDAAGRLALRDLNGDLDWDAAASRPASTLSWQSLAFYHLPFDAASLRLRSDGGALALAAPARIPLLNGALSLQQLAWRPAADRQDRINASFAVSGIDVGALCKAFGWPQFTGTLGGAVPALSYNGDRIAFDGGLSMNVFDGFVDVTRLALQQPFGVAPVLGADIDLRQIDLGKLTGVFDFGSITGPLGGSIHGLKLVNWQPVAFDADLQANDGGRISQRALKSLTSVGGGGIAAGIQGLALNLFKTFGYSRIGLSCTLRSNVCTMGGLQPDGGDAQAGYTIVEGSGLPRISVVGHERRVDWDTLVDRLKAATEGNGPVIQ
ncbi:MAG: hypothetical protein JSS21_11900 [Proteobacteria bacterium]|nr:hypothetical protein [Pseudomonadota bacterium]